MWVIDLYQVRGGIRTRTKMPYIFRSKTLSLVLSLSHNDPHEDWQTIRNAHYPHLKSLHKKEALLWFDEGNLSTLHDNAWSNTNPIVNEKLATKYGFLVISPLSKKYGEKQLGIIAVHVGADFNKALTAHGAFSHTDLSRVYIKNASDSISELLSK